MKQLYFPFLFFLYFCAAPQVTAQYQSIFGQNSTEWVFEWFNLDMADQDTTYIISDTVVNGYLYKKIGIKNLGFTDGLIREDTIQGKVWYRALQGQSPFYEDTTELLLFDYTLALGDTFLLKSVWSNPSDSIGVVDSVYYDNYGRKCIRFGQLPMYFLISGNEKFTMIEGIGSNYGIMYKVVSFPFLLGQYLLCYHRDGVQMYMNAFYNSCFVHDGTPVIEIEAAAIRLYPNPTQDYLYVENPTAMELTDVTIYNHIGQVIKKCSFSAAIDLSQLPQGLYYIQLSNRQEVIRTQVIFKN